MQKKLRYKNMHVLGGFVVVALGLFMCGCGADNTSKSQETEMISASQTDVATDSATMDSSNLESETLEESQSVFGSFEATTLQGESVDESVFENAELTMINIWATYCSPCINEMPDLATLDQTYKEQGFQVIGIVIDVSEPEDETALKIIDSTGADYTHLILNQALYDSYINQVQAVPTTIFVDNQGMQIGETYMGSQDEDTWASIIEQNLDLVEQE